MERPTFRGALLPWSNDHKQAISPPRQASRGYNLSRAAFLLSEATAFPSGTPALQPLRNDAAPDGRSRLGRKSSTRIPSTTKISCMLYIYHGAFAHALL